MKIELSNSYQKLPYILEIRHGKLGLFKVAILVIITLISLGIPLLLYWRWKKFKNIVNAFIFEEVQEQVLSTSTLELDYTPYYLVMDSKRFEGENRKVQYQTHLIKPYLIQNESTNTISSQIMIKQSEILCQYIEHKHQRYLIKDNILMDLKYKIKKQIWTYIEQGLSHEESSKQSQIYGTNTQGFYLGIFDIFRKMSHFKRLRFIYALIAIQKIVIGFLEYHSGKQASATVPIAVTFELFITMIFLLAFSILGMIQHNKMHKKFQYETKHKILRNGQLIEVKLNDLLVGDVVEVEVGQIIYFKGIFVGQNTERSYVVVNEKLYNRENQPRAKYSLLSHLSQVTQSNIINPGSQILSLGLKNVKSSNIKSKVDFFSQGTIRSQKMASFQHLGQKQVKYYIIVAENNSIQKFFEIYSQYSNFYNNYSSPRTQYDYEQFIFSLLFFIIALAGTLMALREETDQSLLDIFLGIVMLVFPFNLLMFSSVCELISIIRLSKQGIKIINPAIQQLGMVDCISIQLSSFEEIQFAGYIKKQRCNRMPTPQKMEDSRSIFESYRRAREQSVYCFLAYCGIMNIPYKKKQPVFQEMFDRYDFKLKETSEFQENNEESSHPRVINLNEQVIKVDLQEFKRFPINQKLIETVIIEDKYTNKIENQYFFVSQGYYTSQECQQFVNETMQDNRSDYIKSMSMFLSRGKKIKYISLKRITVKRRKNDTFSKGEISSNNLIQQRQRQQQQRQIEQQVFQKRDASRERIESKMMFGGFLIFDDWPDEAGLGALYALDGVKNQLGLVLISGRPQTGLAGYDHLLRDLKIHYGMTNLIRKLQIDSLKRKRQCVTHIGRGLLDQAALLAADVSINNIDELSPTQADFHLKNPVQVIDIVLEGRWQVDTMTLTIILIVLFNFSKIIGRVFLHMSNYKNKLQADPLQQGISKILIVDIGAIFMPILLFNLYKPEKQLKKKYERRFLRVYELFYVALGLVGFITLYLIQFLDHGFEDKCDIETNTGLTNNQNHLRKHFQMSEIHLGAHIESPCQSIIHFLSISFSLLMVLLIDRETKSRIAHNIYIAHANKVYMFLLWIGSIFYFNVPFINIVRAGIIILIMMTLMLITQWFRNSKSAQVVNKQPQQQQQNDRNQFDFIREDS